MNEFAVAVNDAADRAARRNRAIFRGTITQLSPLSVELHHAASVVSEEENLRLSKWARFYDLTTGLAVDDAVLLSRVDSEYTIIDVEGVGDVDIDPIVPGAPSPATVAALGTVKLSTAASNPAQPIAVSDTDPRNANARTPTAHTHPESDIVGLATDLAARELIANKGVAGGYAPLDGSSKLPLANLPVHTHAESDVTNLVTDLAARELTANKGATNGYAPLVSSKVPVTNLPDGTTTTKGIVQLAGDLAGTAASPTVPALANKQDTSAKGAASGYAGLDGGSKVPVANLPDATTGAKGIIQLAGDLAGTAAAPSIAANVIVDADVNTAAAIAESKLSLATDAAAGTGSRRTLGGGALQAMPGNRTLDAIAVAAADVDIATHKLINVVNPVANQDASTKAYTDIAAADPTLPTGAKLMSMDRYIGIDNITMAGSGILQLQAVGTLIKGVTYNSVVFLTAVSGASGLTHRWGCLVRASDLSIVAISADNVTTTMSGNTFQTYTFASAYTPTANEVVLAGIMIAGTTLPTLRGRTGGNTQQWGNVNPILAATSSTGMTTPPATGTAAGALTVITNALWVYVT